MIRKLVLALLAPLLLFACATEAEQPLVLTDESAEEALAGGPALATLQAAPDLAAEAESAAFEMVFEFELPDAPVELRATGGYSGDRMTMEMDFGSMLAGLAESAGETLPPGFDEPMQMVVDGQRVYMRMPMLDMLTGTSGWLSATPEDLATGGDALGLTGTTSSPSQMLEMLRGIAGDVEEKGMEEVRGVSTTRYGAVLDFEEVLAEIPAEQREQMEAQLDQIGGMGLDSVPVDVWVGDDGLPRRLQLAFDGMGEALGVPGSATMTLELFDWGEPVDIQVPAAEDVTPLVDVMPGLGGIADIGGSAQ